MTEPVDAAESIERTMARLARSIVADLVKADMHDKLEGMKVLTAYYVALHKHPPKSKKSEDETSFADFTEDMGEINKGLDS